MLRAASKSPSSGLARPELARAEEDDREASCHLHRRSPCSRPRRRCRSSRRKSSAAPRSSAAPARVCLSRDLAMGPQPISAGLRLAAIFRSSIRAWTIRRSGHRSTTSRSARSPGRCASGTARSISVRPTCRCRPTNSRSWGLAQFPIVIGGVVAVVNIDGVGTNQIKFTGRGSRRHFPRQDPGVVASLRSGAQSRPETARCADRHRPSLRRIGYDLQPGTFPRRSKPTMARADGRQDIAAVAIGNRCQAERGCRARRPAHQELDRLRRIRAGNAAQTRNGADPKSGRQFVTPEAKTFQTAAASAEWAKTTDFNLMLTDAPGDEAYPITATVFVLMQRQPASPRRSRAA